jgi:hypothetical protein
MAEAERVLVPKVKRRAVVGAAGVVEKEDDLLL